MGKSDLYLVCRSLGGSLKTSLHESGRWHVAYEKETFEAKVQGMPGARPDRFIEKWPKPSELAPEITLAYRLVIPSDAISSHVGEEDARVLWLPNAPRGQATEIDVLLVSKDVHLDGWPGKGSMGTLLVGSVLLDSGDTAFAVHWTVGMPERPKQQPGQGRFFRGMSRADLLDANLRAIAFGSEPDGSRTIYDLAVKLREEAADGGETSTTTDTGEI